MGRKKLQETTRTCFVKELFGSFLPKSSAKTDLQTFKGTLNKSPDHKNLVMRMFEHADAKAPTASIT